MQDYQVHHFCRYAGPSKSAGQIYLQADRKYLKKNLAFLPKKEKP